jgi:hypothetical protein
MPEINVDDVTKFVKDAAYIAIGFGVLTVQKAQVQRRELTGTLRTQADEARDQFGKLTDDTVAGWEKLSETVEDRFKLIEERVSDIEERVEAALDDVEAKLPGQAAELVKQARAAARDARGQVRSIVNRAA